jgi:hypothetical protein
MRKTTLMTDPRREALRAALGEIAGELRWVPTPAQDEPIEPDRWLEGFEFCGAVRGHRCCILDKGHEGRHGWDTENTSRPRDVQTLAKVLHRLHTHDGTNWPRHADGVACGWGYYDGVSDCATFADAILAAIPLSQEPWFLGADERGVIIDGLVLVVAEAKARIAANPHSMGSLRVEMAERLILALGVDWPAAMPLSQAERPVLVDGGLPEPLHSRVIDHLSASQMIGADRWAEVYAEDVTDLLLLIARLSQAELVGLAALGEPT